MKMKQKLHFATTINAPKEKVWDTMLQDATFRQWTALFNPNGSSWYEGDWIEAPRLSPGSHLRMTEIARRRPKCRTRAD
jgi:uncharacterized protein YndB with AHSA1/START domain